jgi:hypothetical protein
MVGKVENFFLPKGGNENENKYSSGFVLTCTVFLLCSTWWSVVCVLRVAGLGLLVCYSYD